MCNTTASQSFSLWTQKVLKKKKRTVVKTSPRAGYRDTLTSLATRPLFTTDTWGKLHKLRTWTHRSVISPKHRTHQSVATNQ